MQLTMREQEKMMISLAAMIAQRRKDKGNQIECIQKRVAFDYRTMCLKVQEGKTVAFS